MSEFRIEEEEEGEDEEEERSEKVLGFFRIKQRLSLTSCKES